MAFTKSLVLQLALILSGAVWCKCFKHCRGSSGKNMHYNVYIWVLISFVAFSLLFSITQRVKKFIFYKSEIPLKRFCYSFWGCIHPVGILTGGSWRKLNLHCFGVPCSNMHVYQSTHAELYFIGIQYGEIHLENYQMGHILPAYSTSGKRFLLMVQHHRMNHGFHRRIIIF